VKAAVCIDAHQHFWRYDVVRDQWITDDMAALRRNFMPADLQPHLQAGNIDGSVAVQADPSEKETGFLLALAEANPFVRGVVGWVDLCADRLSDRLEYYASFQRLKGFRHLVQGEAPGFLSRPEFLAGVAALARYQFTYDLLIYSHQLTEAIAFVDRVPNQRIVIDHLAKPPIRAGAFDTWVHDLTQLAEREHVHCKLSGWSTEADWAAWKPDDIQRYLDVALAQFGPRRLMYGSDWPVCLLASSYDRQLRTVEQVIDRLSPTEKESIMGANAIQFYNL